MAIKVIEVILGGLSWYFEKYKDDTASLELFYKFIDKQHEGYLNSAKMRILAKARIKTIFEKPFIES